jgi:thiol-disulfide isomerase/thioredoxin
MKLKIAVVLVAVISICLIPFSAHAAESLEGKPLNDFVFEGVDGSSFNTSSLRGKPIVLVIAATWCPPCKREAPALEKAYQEYKDKDVLFIGVFAVSSEKAIKKFGKKYGLTFPLGKADDIKEQFGWKSFPKTAFISPDGTIKSVHGGEISHEELIKGIEEIME